MSMGLDKMHDPMETLVPESLRHNYHENPEVSREITQ